MIKDRANRRAVVIEAKIAKSGEKLAPVCEEALSQIKNESMRRRQNEPYTAMSYSLGWRFTIKAVW
ncbi:MAG: hypothetical protein HFG82_13945 [Dorea sp.]|nr:hypothetical protein [Dorea sp.]